jgi:hypothetical protein
MNLVEESTYCCKRYGNYWFKFLVVVFVALSQNGILLKETEPSLNLSECHGTVDFNHGCAGR